MSCTSNRGSARHLLLCSWFLVASLSTGLGCGGGSPTKTATKPPQSQPPGVSKSPETDKNLSYGDELKRAITEFEAAREATQRAAGDAHKSTRERLDAKPVDLSGAAKDWEHRWNSTKEKVVELEERFSNVGKRSETYFSQLQVIVDSIGDSTRKKRESTLVAETKKKWTEKYTEASGLIQRLSKMAKEGDDFHKSLQLAALRGKLEDEIAELSKIIEQANELLPKMKSLTEEGLQLTLSNSAKG